MLPVCQLPDREAYLTPVLELGGEESAMAFGRQPLEGSRRMDLLPEIMGLHRVYLPFERHGTIVA